MTFNFYDHLDTAFWYVRNGVRNLIRWFPVIWHDHDWDWAYLLAVMEFKFRGMQESFEKYGHLEGNEKHAREVRICAVLCNRMRKDEYLEHFVGSLEAHIHAPLKVRDRAYAHEQMMQKQDLEYLLKLMRRKLRCWWD